MPQEGWTPDNFEITLFRRDQIPVRDIRKRRDQIAAFDLRSDDLIADALHVAQQPCQSIQPAQIASTRGHNRELIIRLEGVENPEATSKYRNALLFVKATELPKLPEGEYYYHQLLGMTVLDEAGQVLGKLVDILETGANDVYVVKSEDGKELLLPAIEDNILSVDPEQRQMRVRSGHVPASTVRSRRSASGSSRVMSRTCTSTWVRSM
jgi:16S rRNA processing protein RimM